MRHQRLLDINWSTSRVEQSAIGVPERVPSNIGQSEFSAWSMENIAVSSSTVPSRSPGRAEGRLQSIPF
jgi:hypothetical protein